MRGSERLVYFNNSPDTLQEVYYHLYLNAFKPGSMMEKRGARLRTALGKRLRSLTADQQGWTTVKHLRQGSQELRFEVHHTILRAELFEALAPGDSTELQMEFESQIPKQTRRNGRDNAEGVDYSMAQWYPKLCEYDVQVWNDNPRSVSRYLRDFVADAGVEFQWTPFRHKPRLGPLRSVRSAVLSVFPFLSALHLGGSIPVWVSDPSDGESQINLSWVLRLKSSVEF